MTISAGIVQSRKRTASVTDSFNRANSTTTLGSTDTGQAWSALQGTWGILSNQGYMAANGSGENYAVIDAGMADCTFTCTITHDNVSGHFCGLAFRVTDANNLYVAQAQSNGTVPSIIVYKRVAGTYTALTSAVNIATSSQIWVVTLSGTSITVVAGAVTAASFTDSTYTTQTKHGLRHDANASAHKFDVLSIV